MKNNIIKTEKAKNETGKEPREARKKERTKDKKWHRERMERD